MDGWKFLLDWNFYLLVILLGVTYKLGFARKLPLLKSLIVYFVLVLGALPLYTLHLFGLPLIPALAIFVAVLLIVRFRRKKSA